jgi:uracil-DNA glycosylase
MPSITQEWKSGRPAPGWREILRAEFEQPYMRDLIRFLDDDRRHYRILPDPPNIFRAFCLTDYNDVRVVILGQDPYPTPGHANGLAFSVNEGVELPRSLQNIYKEIQSDLGRPPRRSGCLDLWAEQGVFLLNASLTVRAGDSNSHRNKGWERLTDRAIAALNERETPMVFILWGRNAQEKEALIDGRRHLILKSVHPSPMSADRGFFGCRHFSKANAFLEKHGMKPVEW